MSFLKFDLTRKQPPSQTEEVIDNSVGSPVREEIVASKSQFLLGRRLAFTISADSIEMAAARSVGRKSRLLDARRVYFSNEAFTPEDRTEQICCRIQEFVAEFGGRRPIITLLVAGPETALRMFEMPRLSPGRLRSAVAFEARKQLPFPINDCSYDYRVVSRITRDGAKFVRIGLIAITRRKLDEQLRYFETLGLEVASVQCAHETVGQMLPLHADLEKTGNFALINIERSGTHLAYYRGENLEFFHSSSLGSNFLLGRTDELRFQNFAEMLGREIQNSLDYYTGQQSSQFTNTVYIYGDLAYSDELIELLDDRFGFAFRRFPVESLKLTPSPEKDLLSSLPVSLSTVAAVVCPRSLANLLPDEQKEVQRIRTVGRPATIGFAALVLMLAMNSVGQYKHAEGTRFEQEQSQALVQAFERSDIFETYQQVKQRVALSSRYFQQVSKKPSHISLTFKEMTRVTPAGLRLISFEYEPEGSEFNMYLSGTIRSATVPPELILAEYVETLSASPLYSQVAVSRHVKRAVGNEFEIEFRIGMRGIV